MTTSHHNGTLAPGSWQRLVQAHRDYQHSFQDFLADKNQRVDELRPALRGPDRALALAAVGSLTPSEKQQLFPEWIHLARSVHGPFQIAWNVILGLPRDWVLDRIAVEVDAILGNEEEDDYWMFLQLYKQLDSGLTQALAQRALQHSEPDIRELGQDYFQAI